MSPYRTPSELYYFLLQYSDVCWDGFNYCEQILIMNTLSSNLKCAQEATNYINIKMHIGD